MNCRTFVPASIMVLTAVASYGQSPAYAAAVDAYVQAQVTKGKSPSVAVAVVRDGKVEYAKGYGLADLENEVHATPETVYRLGSITKQFTATMVMQLFKEGKLSLDDPFQKYLDGTPKAWSKITVRNLLNHTSGIKNYTEVDGLFENDAMKPVKPAGIIKTVAKLPLQFTPGSKWNYCNTGYELLGMIIEKLDKRPYSESLQARILDPLGMKQTYFTSERAVVKHRAQGYSQNPGRTEHAPYLNMDWPYAAGSMESTVLDLAKWDASLYGEQILPQSFLKQMWTPTKLSNGKIENYGYGWGLSKIKDIQIVEHGGGIHGFSTDIRRAPSKGLTVIVLENNDEGNPAPVARQIMGIVDPLMVVAEAPTTLDSDTKADESVRKLLQSLIDGKLNRKLLTPKANTELTKDMEAQFQTQGSQLGPIKGFKLVDVKPEGTGKRRTYHVEFAPLAVRFVVVLEPNGLVSSLGIRPEE